MQCLPRFLVLNESVPNICVESVLYLLRMALQLVLSEKIAWTASRMSSYVYFMPFSACVLLNLKFPSSASVVGPSSHASHAQGTSFYICKRLQFACNCLKNPHLIKTLRLGWQLLPREIAQICNRRHSKGKIDFLLILLRQRLQLHSIHHHLRHSICMQIAKHAYSET